MDSQGIIHRMPELFEDVKKLEERVGPLVRIPPDELQQLRNATPARRKQWYLERAHNALAPGLTADEQRAQRNAAKRLRRELRAQ